MKPMISGTVIIKQLNSCEAIYEPAIFFMFLKHSTDVDVDFEYLMKPTNDSPYHGHGS